MCLFTKNSAYGNKGGEGPSVSKTEENMPKAVVITPGGVATELVIVASGKALAVVYWLTLKIIGIMSRLKMGFLNLSTPEKLDRAEHIAGMMTGNANFPTPAPPLADFIAAIDAARVAYNNSREGGTSLTILMRLRLKEMMDIMRKEAAYVQDVSAGNTDIILSSGFSIVQRGDPLAPVGQVLNLRTLNGSESGSIRLLWDKVVGAGAYIVEISGEGPLPDAFQIHRVVLSTRYDITGLIPGKMYWVRVLAVGRNLYGLPSDVSVHNASV